MNGYLLSVTRPLLGLPRRQCLCDGFCLDGGLVVCITVARRTSDRDVAGSTPGRSTAR